MKRTARGLRTVFALALVFAFTAALAPQVSAATSTYVYIHKADCATNVKGNIYDQCHGNTVAGVQFNVGGVDVTTNSKGVAKAKVVSGTIAIHEYDFAANATAGKVYVFCSVPKTGQVLYSATRSVGTINVKVPKGTVVCDWYDRTTPPPPHATITIHKASCPASVTTGNIFDQCHKNATAGVEFLITDDDIFTGVDGHGTAVVVPTNTWVTITEPNFATLATAGKAYVFCSVQPGGDPVRYAKTTTTGTIKIHAYDGETIICDWYNRTS